MGWYVWFALSRRSGGGGSVLANWNTLEILQVLRRFFKWNRMVSAKAPEDIMFIKLWVV